MSVELRPLFEVWRPEHVESLRKVVLISEDFTVEDVIASLDSGELEAWGLVDSDAIVCTKTLKHLPIPLLHIEFVVGSNVTKVLSAIVADLKLIARERGLVKITAATSRKGWQKFTSNLGFEPVRTEYEMRI
jgi:hypothetical protein